MPFQPFNYANIPVNQGRDLVGSLIEGYKAGKLPQQYKRQAEAEDLANAIARMKFEQMPEEQRIANMFKEAQAQKLQQEAENLKKIQNSRFGFLQNVPPGEIGQLVGLQEAKIYAQQNPEDKEAQELAKNLESSLLSKIEKDKQLTKRYNVLNSTQDVRLLTPDAKREREGWARALGLTPEEANKRLQNGESLADIAASQGKDISQLEPIYALTPIEIRQQRQREGFQKEIDVLSEKIEEPLSQTARQLMDVPIDMVYNQLKGTLPDDDFARILAARAIVPELNALRYKNLGGTVGITALHDMEDKINAKFKVLKLTISPEVSKMMNRYIRDWIKEGTDAYSAYLKESSRIKSPDTENPETIVVTSEDFFKTLGKKK